MNETEIDEEAWAERYVTGRLDASDLERFEAHLVDCPACLDRVETAARLGVGLQRAGSTASPFMLTPPPRALGTRAAGWSAPPPHRCSQWAGGSSPSGVAAPRPSSPPALRMPSEARPGPPQLDRAREARTASACSHRARRRGVPVLVLITTAAQTFPASSPESASGGVHRGARGSSPLLALPSHLAEPYRNGRLARHGCAWLAGGGLRRARFVAGSSRRVSAGAGGTGAWRSLDARRRAPLPYRPRVHAIARRRPALSFRHPERSSPCLVPNPPTPRVPRSASR